MFGGGGDPVCFVYLLHFERAKGMMGVVDPPFPPRLSPKCKPAQGLGLHLGDKRGGNGGSCVGSHRTMY